MSEEAEEWIVREWTLRHPKGLHARPASLLVKTTRAFQSEIQLLYNQQEANCKSLFSLLTLCVTDGSQLHLRARGPDAGQALEAVMRVLESPEFLG